MNNLFSKEEKKQIIQKSHFLYDDASIDDNFDELIDIIAEAFFCDEKELVDIKDLFLPEKELYVFKVFFEPFWKIVLYLCRDIEWKKSFLNGAFHDFRENFIDILNEYYGYSAKKAMEEMLNEKCPPHSSDWLDKAKPLIFGGKHFYYMALNYSIYAKQIIYFIIDYVNYIKEVVYEINNELPKVYEDFFPNDIIKKVKHVSASNSDRHNHGKSVRIITFEDGKKLVYKPHSLSIDRAWNKMLSWVCDSIKVDNFIKIKSIDTLNGGFCTYIEHQNVKDEKDIKKFFMNQGILMCLIYLLHGNDIHAENVIAVEEKPVIVDMETVILPPKILISKLLNNYKPTVFFPAFLPLMGILPGFNDFGIDSLTSIYMGSHNLPSYNEKYYIGSDYVEDIVKGFKLLAEFFIENRENFYKKIKECFLGAKIRMVLKSTSLYCKTLMVLATEKSIKDINKYETIISYLNKEYSDKIKDDIEYIRQVEHIALQRLDVPYFQCEISDVELDELEKELDKITANDFVYETEKIRWALKKTKAKDAINEKYEIIKNDNTIKELLDEKVDILLDVLDDKYKSILTVKPDEKYLVNLGDSIYYPLLDATLGIYVALSAYSKINNNNKRVNERLSNIYDDIYKKNIKLVGYTFTVPGLADGLGGILLGSKMLYDMKIISKDIYFDVIKVVEEMSDSVGKVMFNDKNFLYGNKGLLVALLKVLDDFKSEKIEYIVNELIKTIYDKKELSNLDKKEIFLDAKKELFSEAKNCIDSISSNNTLVYGNAGVLYNNIEKIKNNSIDNVYNDKLEEYVKNILSIKSAIQKFPPPKGCIEAGLFTGISGVVYSVCKYLDYNNIPSII